MGDQQTLTKESLKQIIQMQPGTESAARAHYQLGTLHLSGGEVEIATTSYRCVPAQWPRWHARAGFAIARIYEHQLDDLESAAREYRKVISLHPESMSAARSYSRMSAIYARLGDAVSSENMRECAMRTYERISQESEDPDERDEALFQFAVASRELQRWDQAIEAFTACRKRAVRDRDAARRFALDEQLGLLHMEREQPGLAAKRFRACLEQVRRKSDVRAVAQLSEQLAACQRGAGDESGAKRTLRSLVTFVHRSKARLSDAQKDPVAAPALVRAYVALDRLPDARKVRTRLRRLKNVEARQTLAEVEALIEVAETS